MIRQETVDEYVDVKLSWYLFWEFCIYYDPVFFADRPFLEEVAHTLQWVFEEYLQGRARSITISMPPRSGKSYITSLFCAWWLGRLPELSVMRNAATASLYRKFSYDTRKIIMSEKFRNVFPDIDLAYDKKDVRGWNLQSSKQVAYFGAGTDGTIIGFGANIAIYDDLIPSIQVALNNDAVEKIRGWKGADHNSRKELDCPEIGIGTRWRKNDVIGDEQAKGNVDRKFEISALVYGDPEFPDGKSFCEKVNKTEFYLKEKKNLVPAIFNAMYQQQPVELEGLLFPLSQLRTYDPTKVDIEKQTSFKLGAIDAAKGGGDFYAMINGVNIGMDIYVPEVLFNTDSTDLNETASVMSVKRNGLAELKFEGNGAWFLMGKSIRNKLQEDNVTCSVRIFNQETAKHTRILAQAGYILNYMVFRSDWEQIPEYRAFIMNLTSYMKNGDAKHDDAPDVAAELMKYYREHFKNKW